MAQFMTSPSVWGHQNVQGREKMTFERGTPEILITSHFSPAVATMISKLQLLSAVVVLLALSLAASAAPPQEPQPQPKALLAFASFVDGAMWTTVIDIANNKTTANPQQSAIGSSELSVFLYVCSCL
jgi:hypothetical protein